MNTNDLNYPMMLDRQLSRNASQQIQAPPDFTGADKMFSSFMTNPMLMRGAGGSVLDPRQAQNTMGMNWLGERGGIAQQSLQNKDQLAQLLMSLGSNIGNLFSQQTGLAASQMNQNTNSGGGFGSIMGL